MIKTCPNCGCLFEAKRKDKLFCSYRCNGQYWRKKHPNYREKYADGKPKKREPERKYAKSKPYQIKPNHLVENAKAAREAGKSYGMYMIMKEKEGKVQHE